MEYTGMILVSVIRIRDMKAILTIVNGCPG